MFYSKQSNSFYTHEIHGESMPADAVEISIYEHAALMQGQTEGKIITADENGRPMLQDPPPAAPYVPAQCTRRQGQLALLEAEKLDDAEALIAAIPDAKQRRAAQIEYEADTWERSNAFVQAMWQQLGGTPEGLDDLFKLAVTL